MTSPDASARPSQVTMAGWGVAVSSFLLVFAAFDATAGLKSLATRDRVAESLSTGSFDGLGISVDDALEIMRWSMLVTGAAAAAACILGIFVLQRNKGARIGLTVAAVPIVLAAPLSGSFLGMFVAAGAAVLWSRPARDWFAGRAPTPPTTPAERPAPEARTLPPVATPWQPPVPPNHGAQQPPPTPGWGQSPAAQPFPQQPDFQAQQPWKPAPAPMPRQVRIACILTWAFSGITAFGLLMVLAVVALDSGAVMTAIKDAPQWDSRFDDDVVLTAIVATSVLFLLWCATASVLAVFVWRRVHVAWILMSICVGGAALVSVLAFPGSLAHLVGASIAAGMLLTKPTRDWFAGR